MTILKRLFVALALTGLSGVATPAAAAPRPAAELAGAQTLAFEMPYDGQATVALYTPEGRLVRVLGQLLELSAGPHTIRWDGMDLWGNLVEPGSELEAKVFTNPGLRAFYEFTVGHAGSPPWLTRPTGEGRAMRTGGWMGDHTPPAGALAFGDRVFLGCGVAEHGHAVIATNLDGEKLWGINGFEGWQGPRMLCTNGQMIFGPAGKKGQVFALDPRTYRHRELYSSGENTVQAIAARGDQLFVATENAEAARNPLAPVLSDGSFDFARSRPAAPAGGRNHPRQLSPREMFSTVFRSGGHFQTGIDIPIQDGRGGVVVAFGEPVTVGTLLIERVAGASSAEVYAWGGDDAAGLPQASGEPGASWERLGQTRFDHRLSLLDAPRPGLQTRGLWIRLTAEDAGAESLRLRMARVLPRRLAAADDGMQRKLPAEAEPIKNDAGPALGRHGWRFRMPASINAKRPGHVVLEADQPRRVDGLVLLNCTSPELAVDVFVGGDAAAVDPADESQWREAATDRAGRSLWGWNSASEEANERYVAFAETVETRALRVRLLTGFGGGPVGMGNAGDTPSLARCAAAVPVAFVDTRPTPASHRFEVRDAADGSLKRVIESDDADIRAMAFAADGTLYAVLDGRLCVTTLDRDELRHRTLNGDDLEKPISITAHGGRVYVGDAARHRVVCFDKDGRVVKTFGDGTGRVAGPWNPESVEQPLGLAVDGRGRLWVAEHQYSPKRVVVFDPDGGVDKQFFGPAEYGGGGFLDPDLKRFYYRSAQYDLDFDAGTWRLAALNDRLEDPRSPAADPNTFKYTKIGRPIHLNGRRYIVGDPGNQAAGPGVAVICILDDDSDVWRPCAVMGYAPGARFLTKNKPWADHWLSQDLAGKSFIWCDRNGDGGYQVEEVELFTAEQVGANNRPFRSAYWGNWIGPDLTFWGRSARLAPSRFTDAGVPIYEAQNVQPFDYDQLAPIYRESFTTGQGATANAKPNYGASSIVTEGGSLILEGQPYVVQPDITLKGGPLDVKPSGYAPEIAGRIMDQPLHYLGTAVTDSPAGEVAMLNGNNGQWFVMSVPDRVLLGTVFTGRDGGWSTDLPDRRGVEVTHRKHGWEAFFGHFIRGHDGRYYVVAGHGFHAISRVEGLDDYRLQTQRITVTPEAHEANARLREALVALAASGSRDRKPAKRTIAPASEHVADLELDGRLDEWPAADRFAPIGDGADGETFDAAWTDDHLVLALRGHSRLGNAGEDPRRLFATGFAMELQYRLDPKQRSQRVSAGDQRLVIARHDGKWVGVRYDYLGPDADPAAAVPFTSPLVTTTVARVTVLDPEAIEVAFRPEAFDGGKPVDWSAEARVSWAALGFDDPPKSFRGDVGVIEADSGGIDVEQRRYWSNPAALPVADLGVEAMITPAGWGTFTLKH